MKYITGIDRNQSVLFPISLEHSIDPNNEVRIIDMFVDNLPLNDFGFKTDHVENGRPAYHPSDLLKLYIYGYLNKTRSSRDLEKECKRNIEVIWLLRGLQPDHNTISNFRRDNPKAIKKVFRSTVQLARHFDLIGGRLIAGDSSKFRAQNSKKNNYNQKKIDRHLANIEQKLDDYNRQLESADEDNKELIEQEIEKQKHRKDRYREIERQLNDADQVQVSTSDPDSRQLIIRNHITEVAYNVQTTVDEKHILILDYKVTNTNDSKAMGNMLERAKSILLTNEFTALYDKGYHTGSELRRAHELGIEAIVAIPDIPSSSHAPDPAYNVSEFHYDPVENTYTCPQGHKLTTNGSWYRKDRRKDTIRVRHYKAPACKGCPVINQCTKNTRGRGRVIERTEHADYIDLNRKLVKEKEHLYKRRQAIVEHPYGTIKRQWGFYYILTKKKIQRASADVGFMFMAYNIRRIINIIGKNGFRKYLESLVLLFLHLTRSMTLKLSRFKPVFSTAPNIDRKFFNSPNRLIFDQIL